MEIVDRATAKSRGLLRYYTGVPCKHGHVSERYTSAANCIECTVLGLKAYYSKDPKRRNKSAEAGFRHRLRKYGLTPDSYSALLKKQKGVCAICKNTCSTGYRLAVDHCHASGRVRGLLCRTCNIVLGKFQDDVSRFARAAQYLVAARSGISTGRAQ